MIKVSILFILSLVTLPLSAQKVKASGSMNSCAGAVNIFENGEFQLQFTGNENDNILESYPSLTGISAENQLWCSYIAAEEGELNFTASTKASFLQMVIFNEESGDICTEIANGKSEIKRLHANQKENTVGLNPSIGGGVLYTLKLDLGDKIYVVFATEEEYKGDLKLDWDFRPVGKAIAATKIVDKRDDDFAPTFSVKVRDKETNKPLVANLSIEGSKPLDALYTGSDFFFNLDRSTKLTIKCDVQGYFFYEQLETISAYEDFELVITLESVKSGKSMKIEDIEFVPGTSEITKSSEPRLNRLKDFLALNSDINVEIQGHVFALGDNSFAGQRISEARAKRVMKYLIDNGIDRSRLKAVGYGNTRPVFVKPKFSYEEQANRRVEIMVL